MKMWILLGTLFAICHPVYLLTIKHGMISVRSIDSESGLHEQYKNTLKNAGNIENIENESKVWPRSADQIPRIYSSKKREKRFFIHAGGGWGRTNLTYKIINTPKKMFKAIILNGKEVRKRAKPKEAKRELRKAFRKWARASTVLKFKELGRKSKIQADIDVRFVTPGYWVNGTLVIRNGSLVNVFYPSYGGDIYFNNKMSWSVDRSKPYFPDLSTDQLILLLK